ncbi:MAG: helix-turn-helix domain-containing protein [Fuerstiella sp.]
MAEQGFWYRQNMIAALPTDQFGMAAKLVLYVLNNYTGNKSSCWPSVESIAGAAGTTTRTVRRTIQKLTGEGIVTVENGGGRHQTNVYRIAVDRLTELTGNSDTVSAFTAVDDTTNPDTVSAFTTPQEMRNPDTVSIKGDTVSRNPDTSATPTTKNYQKQTEERVRGTRKSATARTRNQYPQHFEAIWTVYPTQRRRDKKPTFEAYQSAVKRIAAADSGDTAKSQQWLLGRVTAFAASHAGQNYSPEPKRWFANERYHDANESWQKFASADNGTSEADSAWLKLIAALADIDTTQRYMDPLTERVGQRIATAGQSIGIIQIKDANEFTRTRELRPRFVKTYQESGT